MINQADVNIKVNLVTKIANRLRGPYTPDRYGSVIIPMSILRRFDCVLADKNESIKEILSKFNGKVPDEKIEEMVFQKCGVSFYNKKCVTFEQLVGDSDNINSNFLEYVNSFSPNIAEIMVNLEFRKEIELMTKNGRLFEVVKDFSEIDFHPDTTDSLSMGYIFEEIIRTYKENAQAGDHYTPREIIELCVELMISENVDGLKKDGKIIRVYDGCCGTGGMLTTTKSKLNEKKYKNKVNLFGQDVNPEAYSICRAEMLMLGESPKNIYLGSTLTEDKLKGEKFDLLITNPPFGIDWKTEKSKVEEETKGSNNRFVGGLPRSSDGQLLFLQNMLSKAEDNARIAIILNGSPLFTGDAGGGESEIRRYIIENNYLEAIVALPDQMFYNTGISTYIWIVSKNKANKRKGKIQLINAVSFFERMSKSLGNKRNRLTDKNIKDIVKIYNSFEEGEYSKIFDNDDFGYSKITIERPLKDEKGEVVYKKGKIEPDANLRDTENVPLKEDIKEYFKREVLPFVPDAWIDEEKIKVGYEIPFIRYFYKYVSPRKSEEIIKEVLELENELESTLRQVLAR